MTPDIVAAVAATEREIGDRFEQLGIAEPHESAQRLVRRMIRSGWRVHPELADTAPPRPRPANPEHAAAELAKAREIVAGKRGNRPELEVDR